MKDMTFTDKIDGIGREKESTFRTAITFPQSCDTQNFTIETPKKKRRARIDHGRRKSEDLCSLEEGMGEIIIPNDGKSKKDVLISASTPKSLSVTIENELSKSNSLDDGECMKDMTFTDKIDGIGREKESTFRTAITFPQSCDTQNFTIETPKKKRRARIDHGRRKSEDLCSLEEGMGEIIIPNGKREKTANKKLTNRTMLTDHPEPKDCSGTEQSKLVLEKLINDAQSFIDKVAPIVKDIPSDSNSSTLNDSVSTHSKGEEIDNLMQKIFTILLILVSVIGSVGIIFLSARGMLKDKTPIAQKTQIASKINTSMVPTISPTLSLASTLMKENSMISSSASNAPTTSPSISGSQWSSSYASSISSSTASSTASSTDFNPTFPGVSALGQGQTTLNKNFFSSFEAGENTPESKALDILIRQVDMQELLRLQNSEGAEYLDNLSATINTKVFQRFAMLSLWISLSNSIETPKGDECEWDFVRCKGMEVTQLNLGRRKLSGTIPTSIGLLASLKRLDLAENKIHGSIPEELYQLTELNAIYFNENQFTGTLSESIGNMTELKHLYLGQNQFHGHIPQNLKYKPLRTLSFYQNRFSGVLPSYLELKNIFYMDLSFNTLTGTIDANTFYKFRSLKHLYLSNNKFEGKIPEGLVTAGQNRLEMIVLNDNLFTGAVPRPVQWIENPMLNTLILHHNQMSDRIHSGICKKSIYEYGDVVQLDADCKICSCKVLCEDCYQ